MIVRKHITNVHTNDSRQTLETFTVQAPKVQGIYNQNFGKN